MRQRFATFSPAAAATISRMNLLRAFTDHPASVGETYGEHMVSAWGFAARMAFGAAACFVHGILPFLCVTTGSGTIRELYARMVSHRVRATQQSGFGSLESASL